MTMRYTNGDGPNIGSTTTQIDEKHVNYRLLATQHFWCVTHNCASGAGVVCRHNVMFFGDVGEILAN